MRYTSGDMITRRLFVLSLLLGSVLAQAQTPSQLIQHALVYDGTGAKPRMADVRIEADHITAIAKHLDAKPGEQVTDAHGLALAPGFIDMHSHADSGIFKDPNATVVIRQGVTTIVGGQDGDSEYPLADYFSRLEKQGSTIN